MADDPGPRFNVAPSQRASVVLVRDGARVVDRLRWGFDVGIATRPINAQAERAATSPLFRGALKARRCLVPVEGFYEWRREGDRKQPMFIRDAADRPLALAGLWTPRPKTAEEGTPPSFTILTTRPTAFVAPIHDRMPLVLPPDLWARWLEPAPAEPGEVLALLEPPEPVLTAWEVAPLVNSTRNDGPSLLERLPGGSPGA